MPNPYIRPGLFEFLEGLAQNNDRAWFEDNKQRYEADVRGPLLSFVEDFDVHLKQISPHFTADARKVGGSLFRIFRDVRFSKDKSPYKTNAGVHFRHEAAKNAYAPGYYLHLDPNQSFIGVGIWQPDTTSARAIREAIAREPEDWLAAKRGKFGKFTMGGDTIKRRPSGVSADHICLNDIMRRDWIGVAEVSRSTLYSKGFMAQFAKTCESATPFMRFLTQALGYRY